VAVRIPQPGSQALRQIAVWELDPWWAPRLQHQFAGSDVAVRSFREFSDLGEASPDVAVFAATDDSEGAIRRLSEIKQRSAGVFTIMIIRQDLRIAEWRLRDLGADIVIENDVSGAVLAQNCRRALSAPEQDRSRELKS